MLDQRRVAAQPDEKRERLFTERYECLLSWAMGLTNQQREAAEDLVQDAFVQFMLGRTRLEEIENIDGYLRRMLRYMHVSRLSRSAQHLHETALSVADYDSGRLGWTAIEPPRRMQAFEELHQVCTYACSRKESSRAGSVFILRFFHEYFPTEIAAVLNTSRHCVDQWQRLARREAKMYTREPRRLRFVNTKTNSNRQQIRYLKSDCDVMLELRQMIFKSSEGECLAQSELAEIYTEGHSDSLTTARLAHIVSCPACLNAVNRLLGLPLLAERYSTESSEPTDPPDVTGGGASGGGSGELTKKFAHRLRETHEHKPNELRIAVNGTLVGSLKISSDLSELNLNLTPDDPVEFVEVTSEQGVQLLFLSLDPAAPQDEQWAWVELSEGRSLEACLVDDNGPTLHVVYKDPVPAEAYITGKNQTSNASSSPLYVVPAVNELREPNVGIQHGVSKLRSWIVRLLKSLRKTAGRPRVSEESITPSPEESLAASLNDGRESAPFIRSLIYSEDRRRSRQRLGLLTVLLSAIVIGGFLVFRSSLSSTMTASVLLEQAIIVENGNPVTAESVDHRVITLEERRSAEGAVVARYKIEIWRNRANRDRAQRLYDESNRLIAAAWQRTDGSRTTYHHGSKPQSQPALSSPDVLLFNLENIWQLEPSPETFAKLIAEPSAADVEERSTTYIVSFDRGRTIGASTLLKATITLNKSNLHAIEQTLAVRRGDEFREYRFGEASFEPSRSVDPKVFEIESTLTGGAGETGSSGDWAIRDLTNSRVPPTPSTSAPPTASAELEVDVAYLLDRAKADRNEQVTLTRSAGGSLRGEGSGILRVEGVVDSQQRKEEFLRALAPVSNNPAVKIDIRTVSEANQQRATDTHAVVVQETQETADTIAVDKELRSYFERQTPSNQTDERIRNYSSRMSGTAYRALFHAIELRRLIYRFAGVDMRTLTPDARAKFLSMVHEHAIAFESKNAVLRQDIGPIFFSGSATPAAEEISIKNDGDLARAVERLHKLALSNNDAIGSAFTISAQSSATAIKSVAFWQSLYKASQLAKAISGYQSSNN
jgi:RNA polymerase sigma factor (sigma-70 family)